MEQVRAEKSARYPRNSAQSAFLSRILSLLRMYYWNADYADLREVFSSVSNAFFTLKILKDRRSISGFQSQNSFIANRTSKAQYIQNPTNPS